MKVIQTTVTEAEHKLIEQYAKKKSMSIKEVLREAVRNTVEGNVDPHDPIFTCSPSVKRTGNKDRGSEEHDAYIYGVKVLIFVDTSAWYAIEVEDDVNHEAACKFLSTIASGIHGVAVTSDYVLDETLTLLRLRKNLRVALGFIEKVQKSKSIRIFWIDEALFEKALDIFGKSERKAWSLTDCASFALMRELSVSEAFTFDSHFREAGLQPLP